MPEQLKARAMPSLAVSRSEWRAITGLSLSTCDRLVARGAIRSMKVGKRRMFLLRDVDRWLKKLARDGAA